MTGYTMEDCYKVLKYLPKSHVDRQEPCKFKEPYIVEGDSVVLETIYSEFNGTDYIEVYLNCNGVDIDVTTLKLGFSPLPNGNVDLVSLNPIPNQIDINSDTLIQYKIDRNNTARDKSRLLTGIKTITLKSDQDLTGITIQNIILKSIDYTYTLSDIETACENGEAYVLRRLNNMQNEKKGIKEIPDTLKQYVYMAGGAYAWLTRWEYEAKPMKEPKSESNNYADRLFAQVDDAISKYLSNIENNRNEEYIQTRLFATARSNW